MNDYKLYDTAMVNMDADDIADMDFNAMMAYLVDETTKQPVKTTIGDVVRSGKVTLTFMDHDECCDYISNIGLAKLLSYLQKTSPSYVGDTNRQVLLVDHEFERAALAIKWFVAAINCGITVSMSKVSMNVYHSAIIALGRFTEEIVNAIKETEFSPQKVKFNKDKTTILSLAMLLETGSLRFHFSYLPTHREASSRLAEYYTNEEGVANEEDYPDNYWSQAGVKENGEEK